jgi:hypothetical protein
VITIEVGLPGTEYDATDVSVPLPGSRVNDWMTGLDWFPTNRNLPLESVAMTVGDAPVPNGEFVKRVNPPSEPTEYAPKLLDP